MIYDRNTGLPRGFCFVTFTTTRAAQLAIEEMDGQVVDGRPIRVSKVVKPNQGPRRGFGDGGGGRAGGSGNREEGDFGSAKADRDSPDFRGMRSYSARWVLLLSFRGHYAVSQGRPRGLSQHSTACLLVNYL